MHRIRTWARAKAHGPSPLSPVPSRSDSRVAPPSPLTPTSVSDGHKKEQSDEPLQHAHDDQEPEKRHVLMRFVLTVKVILFSSIINVLLVFVPVGIAVHFAKMPAGVIFAMNAIAIIPLAGLLSHATESVASRLGDTVGALLNVTFGNAVELIIFIIALVQDHIRIVQASLVGSILANLLLILGMCFLFGGLRYREQIYNSTVTQMSACLLALSVTSLLLPTAFHASFSNATTADDKVLKVSRGTSIIILLVYLLYLFFQLKSHSYMYASTPQYIIERESAPGPAAQYFNPSAEASASESDSDESSRSERTAQRFRRMVRRGKKTEGSVISERDTIQGSDTVVATPVSSGFAGAGSIEDVDAITPAYYVSTNSTADEAAEKTHRRALKHRKHRNKSNGHRRHGTGDDQDTSPHRTTPSPPERSQETGRLDFAAGPALEAQPIPSRSRPLSILTIRPSITNIFTPRTANSSSAIATTAPHPGIRRAVSEPISHRRFRHRHDIPPIIPIPVDSNPQPTPEEEESQQEKTHPTSRTTATLLLLLSTALVAVCAEFMVSSIDDLVATDPGLSEAFIGLILLPLVGNAAEHVTAVSVAWKNKMDLAIGVAVGSSIQIALFVTPLVVIVGWAMGKEMGLFFTLFETVCVFVSAFIVNFLVLDGRSNYLEGALLCAGYVIIAVAAFFYPDVEAANSLGGGD